MLAFCVVVYTLVAFGTSLQIYAEDNEPVGLAIVMGLFWPVIVGYTISKNAG